MTTSAESIDTQPRLDRFMLGISHDPVTGLRNQLGLIEEIARDPALATLLESQVTITIRVDLPPSAAGKLLALVGMRIARSIRSGDIAAHLGDGKFVVIVTVGAEVPTRTAKRLQIALGLPYVVDGMNLAIPHKIQFARLDRENSVFVNDPLPSDS